MYSKKRGDELTLGQQVWTVGRVIEAEVSKRDGFVRAEVVIEYSNASEWRKNKPSRPFRQTKRAARSGVVLHSEDDLH